METNTSVRSVEPLTINVSLGHADSQSDSDVYDSSTNSQTDSEIDSEMSTSACNRQACLFQWYVKIILLIIVTVTIVFTATYICAVSLETDLKTAVFRLRWLVAITVSIFVSAVITLVLYIRARSVCFFIFPVKCIVRKLGACQVCCGISVINNNLHPTSCHFVLASLYILIATMIVLSACIFLSEL